MKQLILTLMILPAIALGVSIRPITQVNDINRIADDYYNKQVNWIAGDSIRFDVLARDGRKPIDFSGNLFPILYVAAETNLQELYIAEGGTVVDATNGHVRVELTSTNALLDPTKLYSLWVTVYRGEVGSTAEVATVAHSALTITPSPMATAFLSSMDPPYQINLGGVTVELDPVFSTSVAASVTANLTSQWSQAYAWGNHATQALGAAWSQYDATQTVNLADNNITNAANIQAASINNDGTTVEIPHIHGSIAGNFYVHIRNGTGSTIAKGTPVYVIGNVAAGDRKLVAPASSSDPTKMPAIAIAETDIAAGADGDGIILGELRTFDTVTPGWAINTEIYVATNGGLTATRPTSGLVQSIGQVSRTNVNSGIVVVQIQGAVKPAEDFLSSTNVFVVTETDPVWSAASNTIAGQITSLQTGKVDLATYTPATQAIWSAIGGIVSADNALTNVTASGRITATKTGNQVAVTFDATGLATGTPVQAESDPIWTAASSLYYTAAQSDALFATGTPIHKVTLPAENVYTDTEGVISLALTNSLYATETSLFWLSKAIVPGTGLSYTIETNILNISAIPSSISNAVSNAAAASAAAYYPIGNPSNYITQATASNTYLPLAGGTMSGDVNFGGGNLSGAQYLNFGSNNAVNLYSGQMAGNWSFLNQPTIPGYLTSTGAAATYLSISEAASTYATTSQLAAADANITAASNLAATVEGWGNHALAGYFVANAASTNPAATLTNIAITTSFTNEPVSLTNSQAGLAFVEVESDLAGSFVSIQVCDSIYPIPAGTSTVFVGSSCASNVSITASGIAPPLGSETNTLFSVRFYQYTSPVGLTNDLRANELLIADASAPNMPASLRQLDSAVAAIRVDSWSDYPALTPIDVNGKEIRYGNNFASLATSNAMSFSYNGSPFLRFIAGVGSAAATADTYIASASITSTQVTLGVFASPGWIPSPEYSLTLTNWVAITNFTSTYPTQSYGVVTLTFAPPVTNEMVYFRPAVTADQAYSSSSEMQITADQLTLLGRRMVINDTNGSSIVTLSATGGLKVGTASFTADAAGNISQDATNTASLGLLSVDRVVSNLTIAGVPSGAPGYSRAVVFLGGQSSYSNRLATYNDDLYFFDPGNTNRLLGWPTRIVTEGSLASGLIDGGLKIGTNSFELDKDGNLAANWNLGGFTLSNGFIEGYATTSALALKLDASETNSLIYTGALTTILGDYATTSGLATALSDYATTGALTAVETSLTASVALKLNASETNSLVYTGALATTLSGYVTTGALETALGGYATTGALATALGGYATTGALTAVETSLTASVALKLDASETNSLVYTGALATTLSGYVTTNALDSTLGGYVTTGALTSTLGSYATTQELYAVSTSLTATIAAEWSSFPATQSVDQAGFSITNAAGIYGPGGTNGLDLSSGTFSGSWTFASQPTIPGYLTTNGSAAALTQFPSSILSVSAGNSNYWRITTAPASNNSFGQRGQMAVSSSNVFIYNPDALGTGTGRWIRITGDVSW